MNYTWGFFLIYTFLKTIYRPKVVFYNRKKSSRETTSNFARARKKCSRGDQCTFAHDESQLRGKPDLAGNFLRDHRSPGARLIWWIWWEIKLKQWYQMISDDFSDASVLSSSKVSVSKMNRTKIQFVCQVQNFAGSTLPDNPAAMVPNVLIRMVQIPDMVHRAARQRQKTDNHIFCQKISSDLISSIFLNQSTKKSRSGSTFMISWCQYFLTVWFQLEEMIQLEERIHICPSCFKKNGLKEAIILELTPSPPRVFSRFWPKGNFWSPQFRSARRLMKWKILRHAMFTSQSWCH